MADKPKGNIFFEIAIVILAIALIATIMYPKQVWQKEDTLESVCRVRMEAIHQLELQYINKVWTYSDSIQKIKDVVLVDEAAIAALDSTINWDKMVESADLKQMVLATSFPEDLRGLISNTLEAGKPLRNLGKWDNLEYRLIDVLEKKMATAGEASLPELDNGVLWSNLLGERAVSAIIENASLTAQEKIRIQQQLRQDVPIQETKSWTTLYPSFYSKLSEIIQTAKRTDVWEKKDQDAWKEVKRAEWEKGLDALSSVEQDSLWKTHERAMWDKKKDVVWKEERKALWNKEKETWPKQNESMWRRIVNQQWETDRKKEWIAAEEKVQPDDSTLAFFKTNKDSLWRTVSDSIQSNEFPKWEKKNAKYIAEVIEGLWQSDKRMEWEDVAHQGWVDSMEKNRSAQWTGLKEELWNTGWAELWRMEEEKLAGKKSSLRRLDATVKWNAVLGSENTDSIVKNLALPNAETVWQKVTEKTEEKGSGLYRYGLAGLFQAGLIDSVDLCPVAKVPYLIHVVDTSTIKKVGIRCPITITADLSVAKYKSPTEAATDSTTTIPTEQEIPAAVSGKTFVVALTVDPATKDTTKTMLKIPGTQKVFGGGSIRPHGAIDEDGKKSWEKKGR